jgi:hypothetical protein
MEYIYLNYSEDDSSIQKLLKIDSFTVENHPVILMNYQENVPLSEQIKDF